MQTQPIAPVRRKVTVAVVIFLIFNLFVTTLVHASIAMRGQLNFQLQTVGESVSVAKTPLASRYMKLEGLLAQTISSGTIADGEKALKLIRAFQEVGAEMGNQTAERIRKVINPKGEQNHILELLTDWMWPIYNYVEGDNGEEEPQYVQVNTDLRNGDPDSAETIKWVTSMRQALSHLPKYEGISFRGARLTKERIEKYYTAGQRAQDLAFISTSLTPSTAFNFAKLHDNVIGDKEEESKINIVFVIKGHTGRPVSQFGNMHAHENEILFANGTPFKVVARSNIFNDKELNGLTQIIILIEEKL